MRQRAAVLTLTLFLVCAAVPMAAFGRAAPAEGGIMAGSFSGRLSTVARGLTNPRGMAWGPDGSLYVALAGTGGETMGTPVVQPPVGRYRGGPTASIVRIEGGCPVEVVGGLPSVRDAEGGVVGVADLAVLGDQLYALVASGGDVFGNPGTTNGIYRVNADGTTTLVGDISAWLAAHPSAVAGRSERPQDFPNPGIPFAMVADEATGVLWVVDAHNALVLTVARDGTIALAADLSTARQDPQPTGIALAPQGGVYVGNLTGVPYPDGAAEVVYVSPHGEVTEVWTGLTAVTGVVVGSDRTLYALELSTGNTAEPPFLRPYSGRVVRQVENDRLAEVATGLLYPIALDAGPDGALYVAQPAFGADDGSGEIVRVEIATEAVSPVAAEETITAECPSPAAPRA